MDLNLATPTRKGLAGPAGTYTPTLTSVANLDSTNAFAANYMRVGNVVTVSGRISVDPTASGTTTTVGISLPVASDFGAIEDCGGVSAAGEFAESGAIVADTTNNRATLTFQSASTASHTIAFTFTYRVI